ncbi:SLAC1 anion channel family protein [bacterium]|nr:SLAC1 anion channel family protein [bacterium]
MKRKILSILSLMDNSITNDNDKITLSTIEIEKIKYFPISFFAAILGLSGVSIATEKFGIHSKIPFLIVFSIFSIFLFLYLLKAILYFDEVKADFKHPIKLYFFSAITISFLLLSIVSLDHYLFLSKTLWFFGIISHFLIFIITLSEWLKRDLKISSITPAWFIPAVGNIVVPIAGVKHAHPEISWFFFSIGLFFWIILTIVLLFRLFFDSDLPKKLQPTYFILIAPPAIGFLSLSRLTKDALIFKTILYYIALFLTIFLFTKLYRFLKSPFYLSWWAYTFPISAITISTFLYDKTINSYYKDNITIFYSLFIGLFTILLIITSFILIRTVIGVIKGEFCLKED